MNIDIITNKIIYSVSEKIKEAETFFSEIATRIQEIFNKFIGSKTEEHKYQLIPLKNFSATEWLDEEEDLNKKVNNLKKSLQGNIISIEEAFGVLKHSFENFAKNRPDELYESLEWLGKLPTTDLMEISAIIRKKTIEETDTDKKSLLRGFLLQMTIAERKSKEGLEKLLNYEITMDDI